MTNYFTEINLDLWNRYASPPPSALKPFNNGEFRGTDINTMWRLKALTEAYGPCGVGWYYDIEKVEYKEFSNTETIMIFATIKLYVNIGNDKWSKGIVGVGGNKIIYRVKEKENKPSYIKANDEALKMVITDAIGNACRNLGFGSKIYWQNDETQYSQSDEEYHSYTLHKEQTAAVEAAKPDKDLVARLEELGGNMEVVAGYYKKPVDAVTADEVRAMIERKLKNLAREHKQQGDADNANQ